MGHFALRYLPPLHRFIDIVELIPYGCAPGSFYERNAYRNILLRWKCKKGPLINNKFFLHSPPSALNEGFSTSNCLSYANLCFWRHAKFPHLSELVTVHSQNQLGAIRTQHLDLADAFDMPEKSLRNHENKYSDNFELQSGKRSYLDIV